MWLSDGYACLSEFRASRHCTEETAFFLHGGHFRGCHPSYAVLYKYIEHCTSYDEWTDELTRKQRMGYAIFHSSNLLCIRFYVSQHSTRSVIQPDTFHNHTFMDA